MYTLFDSNNTKQRRFYYGIVKSFYFKDWLKNFNLNIIKFRFIQMELYSNYNSRTKFTLVK
jgi:hypothetical protein